MRERQESKEETALRKAKEISEVDDLDFRTCANERIPLAKWMVQNSDFDAQVHIELCYERTKHLDAYEVRQLMEQIMTRALNMMDRALYGNRAHRHNDRGTRFVCRHTGYYGHNEHLHALIESDKRIDYTTYCAVLENILKHLFVETSDGCRVEALRENRARNARYITHEYKKLGNETLLTGITNIGRSDINDDFLNDINKRLQKLRLKIFKKAIQTQHAIEAKETD